MERLRSLEGAGLRTFRTAAPRAWERTSGAEIWDADGNRYLDLDAASAVATVGHCHPRVTEAIVRQAPIMTHAPSGTPSKVRADFYEKLLSIAPAGMNRALPAVNGALANETAIHLARAHTGRRGVISFSGTYAGRSVGTVGLAGKRAYREAFGEPAAAVFAPYPDLYRSVLPGDAVVAGTLSLIRSWIEDPASGVEVPACILIEPVQGNGGVVEAPDEFLLGLREICDESGIVLIFDEIQSGFGRVGTTWASDRSGVVPDLMVVGKGIGGGLSSSAVLGNEVTMSNVEPDAFTSTFILNLLNAAAATAAIEVFENEQLASRSADLGARAKARIVRDLAGHPHVGDVRGRGLLIGLEIVTDLATHKPDAALAAEMASAIGSQGVLVGRSGRYANVLKVCPPLVITEEQLDDALDVVITEINDFAGKAVDAE